MPVADFVGQISSRTGLKDDEVRRGISAVLTTLRGAMDDPAYLDHMLALLPKDYRSLEAA